ncbi:hypothetical protein [Xanthobacter sp. ZOL 2024]
MRCGWRASAGAPGPGLGLIGALYLTQGIPIGFLFEALPVLLRQRDVPLEAIAFLPLAALPWIFKFLWAPLVDNRFSHRLGRRRSWILPMQTVLVAALAVCAFLPPTAQNVGLLLASFLVGSVAAATQDTASDGLAAESLTGARLATANALQAGGMMAGFMLGGAGALSRTCQMMTWSVSLPRPKRWSPISAIDRPAGPVRRSRSRPARSSAASPPRAAMRR